MTKANLIRKFFVLAAMVLCTLMSNAQNIAVKGTVIDQAGNPLIGVAVIENGTTNGVMTLEDGSYSINAPADAVLVFSCMGYTTREIPASDSKALKARKFLMRRI